MIKLDMTRVLTPVDFTEISAAAIDHAASMVRISKGELLLLYVQRKKSLSGALRAASGLKLSESEPVNYQVLLEKTAAEISKRYGIKVKTILSSGMRVQQIVKTAEKERVGLIVMGTRGSSSNSSLLLGSNSHRVVSDSGVPVLTVRNGIAKPAYKHILLPVDSSEHTRQKVQVAMQMAKLYNASIRVLGMLDDKEADYRGKLEVILHQVTAKIKENHISVSSEVILTGNAAGSTILRASQEQADLIIAMTDQHTAKSSLLARSYDHQLVDESDIAVLSVPPEIHLENIESVSFGGL